MIIVMKSGSPRQEIDLLLTELSRWNVVPELSVDKHKVAIGLIGDPAEIDVRQVQKLNPFIKQVQNKYFKWSRNKNFN